MPNALQLNGNQDTSATTGLAATALQMVSDVSGTTTSAKTTLIGTSTGYGEIWSKNQAGAWAAAGSIGSPDGHGFAFDSSVLDNQQIVTGNWTPVIRAVLSVGTATADMYVRVYRYVPGTTTYNAIGTLSKTGNSLSTTITTYTFTAASLSSMNFNVGDKLYMDVWLNITANSTGSSAATFNLQTCNNPAKGRSGNMQLTSPGYQPIPGLNTVYLITNRKQVGRIQ